MIDPGSNSYEISLQTDRRAAIFLEPRLEYWDRRRGGHRWETQVEITLRPTPSLEVELTPQYTTELEPAQYVTQTDDLGFEPTFGRRYLFSDLKRRQFSVETRLNAVFNPRLSLQLYAQPLVSSGDYLTYKQLARAESFDFDVFEEGTAVVNDGAVTCMGGRTCVEDDERYVDFDGDGVVDYDISDRDFNIHSLRMNAVLRWEFRPGSTLFLVWQQSRRDRRDIGSFKLGRDIGALWDLDAENVFIIKVDYWLGL